MIIIAFKGAISDFLQSHSAVNYLQHARSSGPGAIVCKSRATHRALITCNMSCYVPLHFLPLPIFVKKLTIFQCWLLQLSAHRVNGLCHVSLHLAHRETGPRGHDISLCLLIECWQCCGNLTRNPVTTFPYYPSPLLPVFWQYSDQATW